jgi:hypothetical protein
MANLAGFVYDDAVRERVQHLAVLPNARPQPSNQARNLLLVQYSHFPAIVLR